MQRTNTFPDDLLEEILSWLPIRHLLRFRCVSKSWCTLIDDYSFIKKHYQLQYAMCKSYGDVPLLLTKTYDPEQWLAPNQVYLLSKQRGDALLNLIPDLRRDSAPFSTNSPGWFDTLYCGGVVNGVVWFTWSGTTPNMGLWNPATRQFVVIPGWSSGVIGNNIGFGFDPVSNNFKIVGMINAVTKDGYTETIYRHEVYSLSTNSWKRINEPPAFVDVKLNSTDAYLNGVYYWAAIEFDREHSFDFLRSVILSFDFSTEVFKVFDPPKGGDISVLGDAGELEWKIALYMDRVAVIVCHNNYREAATSVDVWVVTKFEGDDECGVPLSWQLLFTVGPIPALNGLGVGTFRIDGDLLLTVSTERDVYEESHLYNPSTRTFKKLEIVVSSCFQYVESLFPLSKRLVQT